MLLVRLRYQPEKKRMPSPSTKRNGNKGRLTTSAGGNGSLNRTAKDAQKLNVRMRKSVRRRSTLRKSKALSAPAISRT